jgi:aspartyl-tRNA(Asn)/glutamyl-tRNA(Gln) amidotransferase subunit C
MAITRADVEHVARLARLALSDDEIGELQEQLARILEHAERVTSLDTDGVPPTSHPIPLAYVFRVDTVGECLTQEEALAGAPEAEAGQFRVPRILEDES